MGLLGQVDLANIGKLVHIDIHNDTGTGVVYGRCLLRDFGLEEASADEGGSLLCGLNWGRCGKRLDSGTVCKLDQEKERCNREPRSGWFGAKGTEKPIINFDF